VKEGSDLRSENLKPRDRLKYPGNLRYLENKYVQFNIKNNKNIKDKDVNVY
jgi:hypothetical protein